MDLDQLAAAAAAMSGSGEQQRGDSSKAAAAAKNVTTSTNLSANATSTRQLRSSNPAGAAARKPVSYKDATEPAAAAAVAAAAAATTKPAGAKNSKETKAAASALQGMNPTTTTSATATPNSNSEAKQPVVSISAASLPHLAFDKLLDGSSDASAMSLSSSSSSSSNTTTHSTPEYHISAPTKFEEGFPAFTFPTHDGSLPPKTFPYNTIGPLPPLPAPLKFDDDHENSINDEEYEASLSVPAKKQKGRRPNATGMQNKNHRCSHEGCDWSFSRREHLKRHEKTHTQERPFTCDVPLCGLKFSRMDNLNSHKRTHEKGKRTAQWHVAKVVGGSGHIPSFNISGLPQVQFDSNIAHVSTIPSPSLASFPPASQTTQAGVKRKRAPAASARRYDAGSSASVSTSDNDDEHDGEYSDA